MVRRILVSVVVLGAVVGCELHRNRDPGEVRAPGGANTRAASISSSAKASKSTPSASSARASKLVSPASSGPGARVAPLGRPWPLHPLPVVRAEWCTDALHALDEQTCYFVPPRPTRTLLLYFHGIVPPGAPAPVLVKLQAIVARACAHAGVAALMPRGMRGLSYRLPGWWTWPTVTQDYVRTVKPLVTRFAKSRKDVEALLGVKFSRVYVAGSSAGAYFAARLMLGGDLAADGFAILSGGGGFLRGSERPTPKPVYIGFGRYDKVGPAARVLGRSLSRAGWSVKLSELPVGHGSKEQYLNEAFEFWRAHSASAAGAASTSATSATAHSATAESAAGAASTSATSATAH